MKLVSILSFYLLSTFSTLYGKGDNKIITHSFDRAEQQYTAMLKALPEPTAYPRTTDNNGKLRTTPLNDWTEGFYPGSLWYIYENNKQNTWKQEAIRWTEALEPLKKQKGPYLLQLRQCIPPYKKGRIQTDHHRSSKLTLHAFQPEDRVYQIMELPEIMEW